MEKMIGVRTPALRDIAKKISKDAALAADFLKEIHSSANSPIVKEQVISGCTCLENDRLFLLKGQPLLNVGDLIVYNNVGAYTMCLSPLFIRYFPNIYIKDKDCYQLVRQKWDVTNYIQKSIFGKNE